MADRQLQTRRYLALGVFVIPYTLAALCVSTVQGNLEFVYYSVVLLMLVLGTWAIDRRVRLPMLVLWGLALWGFIHLLAGILPIPISITEPGSPPNLYNMRVIPWLPKFDQVVHAYGFGVATFAAWYALRETYPAPPRLGHGLWLAVVFIGMGLGALNEVIEFIATRLMPGTNVGGYENTGWDLVSNCVGCTIAGVTISFQSMRDFHAVPVGPAPGDRVL